MADPYASFLRLRVTRTPLFSRPKAKASAADTADMTRMADPTSGMSDFDKFAAGMGGGATKTGLGIKNLFGFNSPENDLEEADWKKNKQALGGWGEAGEIAGEVAATAPIGGGASAITGKVLTKAVPKLAQIAKAGGRVLNPGTVGDAAVQGATAGGVMTPEGPNDSRLGNATSSAILGATLPGVAGAVTAPIKGVYNTITNAVKPAQVRAAKYLEKTLGAQKMKEAESFIASGHPEYSGLPEDVPPVPSMREVASMLPSYFGRVGRIMAGRTERATNSAVTQALQDPQAFLRMMAAKRAKDMPLSKSEQIIMESLMAQSRGIGGATAGE